jgi:ABC-type antimicrobial peptide transport system permease subunit
LWPGQPALGQTLLLGPKVRPVNVIGVYPDALIENHRPGRSDAFFVLLAEQQDPAPVVGSGRPDESGEITFYLKYSTSLSSVEAGAVRAIQDVDNRIALVYVRTMEQQLDTTRFAFRPLTLLLTVFSATSLLIATIGQYSVIAFDMRRRNREFGVRLAIGASSRQIVGSVIREGFVLTVAGLVIGFALSVGTGKLIEIVLYGVTGTDIVTYAGVFTLLAIASLLACYVPARRASQADPLEALRCD